jgi:LPS-assembly lipoprotein
MRHLSRSLVVGPSRHVRASSRAFGTTLASISSPFRVLLCVLTVISLSSCGFRLRGSVELPPEVRRVYVATADELTPFAVELREALSRNGATLAPAAGAADAVVRVRSDRTGRRVLSVSARNTPEEFEVFYVVDYSIDRGGQEVVPSQVLELTRSFSFDEADLLAKDREEDILREAMARDIAGLIVRRLGSL